MIALIFSAGAHAGLVEDIDVSLNDDAIIVLSTESQFGFWQASPIYIRSPGGHLVPSSRPTTTPFKGRYRYQPDNRLAEFWQNFGLVDFEGAWVTGIGYMPPDPSFNDLVVEVRDDCGNLDILWPVTDMLTPTIRERHCGGDRVRLGIVEQEDSFAVFNNAITVGVFRSHYEGVVSLDRYELSNSDDGVFELIGFEPLDALDEVSYDIRVNTNVPPGFYRSTLTFDSDTITFREATVIPTSFELQVTIVPEASIHPLVLLLPLLHCIRRCVAAS